MPLPDPDVEILLAQESHFDDAWALLEEYFEAVQVVVRDQPASLSSYAIWLAYVDKKAAGCILLRPLKEQSGEVKRLYVRPQFRRLGLAGRLLTALEAHAARGMTELYLDSKDDLVDAIRFYQRAGYTRCERYNDNPQATVFLKKSLSGIVVRPFQAGDERAFWELNEAWISKLFKLEDKDLLTLKNPQKYVLGPGGHIYMACRGDVTVGCCALVKLANGSYELAKMGVAEAERGKGIGRLIIDYAVHDARRLGIRRLYLETNQKLENAIHLYEAMGFRHVDPDTPSPYQRANVFMELLLT